MNKKHVHASYYFSIYVMIYKSIWTQTNLYRSKYLDLDVSFLPLKVVSFLNVRPIWFNNVLQ